MFCFGWEVTLLTSVFSSIARQLKRFLVNVRSTWFSCIRSEPFQSSRRTIRIRCIFLQAYFHDPRFPEGAFMIHFSCDTSERNPRRFREHPIDDVFRHGQPTGALDERCDACSGRTSGSSSHRFEASGSVSSASSLGGRRIAPPRGTFRKSQR